MSPQNLNIFEPICSLSDDQTDLLRSLTCKFRSLSSDSVTLSDSNQLKSPFKASVFFFNRLKTLLRVSRVFIEFSSPKVLPADDALTL